jgi:hypothetical protein
MDYKLEGFSWNLDAVLLYGTKKDFVKSKELEHVYAGFEKAEREELMNKVYDQAVAYSNQ